MLKVAVWSSNLRLYPLWPNAAARANVFCTTATACTCHGHCELLSSHGDHQLEHGTTTAAAGMLTTATATLLEY